MLCHISSCMAMAASNPHIGSALDDFLEGDGVLVEARTNALKRVFVWRIGRAVAEESISKAEKARRRSAGCDSLL